MGFETRPWNPKEPPTSPLLGLPSSELLSRFCHLALTTDEDLPDHAGRGRRADETDDSGGHTFYNSWTQSCFPLPQGR